MDAIQTYELILASVKTSQLNFVIKESPFSLDISLKKSFIKVNSPTSPNGFIQNGNDWKLPSHSESRSPFLEINQLKEHLSEMRTGKEALEDTVEDLAAKLEKSKGEISELLMERKSETREKSSC